MLKRITKKKHLLLTAAVLAAMTIPVQAAEKKPDAGKEIKTGAVVVTASRTKQEVKETPSSVEVITREDIDKMGAESVRQALQLAIGLDTTETGMVGNQVSIRGAQTNQTLILIDGRRVRSEDTSSTMNATLRLGSHRRRHQYHPQESGRAEDHRHGRLDDAPRRWRHSLRHGKARQMESLDELQALGLSRTWHQCHKQSVWQEVLFQH